MQYTSLSLKSFCYILFLLVTHRAFGASSVPIPIDTVAPATNISSDLQTSDPSDVRIANTGAGEPCDSLSELSFHGSDDEACARLVREAHDNGFSRDPDIKLRLRTVRAHAKERASTLAQQAETLARRTALLGRISALEQSSLSGSMVASTSTAIHAYRPLRPKELDALNAMIPSTIILENLAWESSGVSKDIMKLRLERSSTENDIGIRTGLPKLVHLSRLLSLNLWSCHIGDAGTATIGQLSWLKVLNIGLNKLSDKGAEHIGKLLGLQRLDISCNEISAAGVGHIIKLEVLQWLNIGANKLGGGPIFGPSEGAKALAKLHKALRLLGVSHNNLGTDSKSLLRHSLPDTQIYFEGSMPGQ